jgi:hypothetical protein
MNDSDLVTKRLDDMTVKIKTLQPWQPARRQLANYGHTIAIRLPSHETDSSRPAADADASDEAGAAASKATHARKRRAAPLQR